MPAGPDAPPPQAGQWMHCTHTDLRTGVSEFERVPPGDWQAWLFDGIGGCTLGLREIPLGMAVRIDEPQETVVFELGPIVERVP